MDPTLFFLAPATVSTIGGIKRWCDREQRRRNRSPGAQGSVRGPSSRASSRQHLLAAAGTLRAGARNAPRLDPSLCYHSLTRSHRTDRRLTAAMLARPALARTGARGRMQPPRQRGGGDRTRRPARPPWPLPLLKATEGEQRGWVPVRARRDACLRPARVGGWGGEVERPAEEDSKSRSHHAGQFGTARRARAVPPPPYLASVRATCGAATRGEPAPRAWRAMGCVLGWPPERRSARCVRPRPRSRRREGADG